LFAFARVFVYRTAREQEMTTAALVRALWEADVHLEHSLPSAVTHDGLPQHVQKPWTHGDVSASNATTCRQSRGWRHPTQRASSPCGLSLMGCVRMAGPGRDQGDVVRITERGPYTRQRRLDHSSRA